MRKKLYLLTTLAVLVFSTFLFSEKALATSCAGGTGSCVSNACPVGKTPIADYNNDCSAATSEVCCPNNSGGTSVGDCKAIGGSCRINCEAGEINRSGTFSECQGAFGLTNYQCCTIGDGPSSQKKEGDTCLKKDNDCGPGLTCVGAFFTTCEKVTAPSTTSTVQGAGASTGGALATSASAASGAGGWSLGNISGFGLPQASITRITGNLLDWILGILAIVGVIGFVISGIIYLVSTGDETMIERAKEAMKWSIVGVIVGLSGVIIIQAVDWALNGFAWF